MSEKKKLESTIGEATKSKSIQISSEDLAYSAGIIDGEGCFCITAAKGKLSKYHQGLLSVGMTDYQAVRFLLKTFGGNLRKHTRPKNPKWKTPEYWTVYTKDAVRVARLVLPYLKVKKAQAELLIEFQESKVSCRGGTNNPIPEEELAKRESFRLKMQALNA